MHYRVVKDGKPTQAIGTLSDCLYGLSLHLGSASQPATTALVKAAGYNLVLENVERKVA